MNLRLWLPLCVLLLGGCKDLKEQQLGAYVGDSQTKIVYKNVGKNTETVPNERRVYFKSVDEAMGQGYTLSNVADTDTSAGEE